MEYSVKYLIGYPGWNDPKAVTVVVGSNAIRIVDSLKNDIVINGYDIVDISFDAQMKRSGTRAATGALIGGVLTGGIGLLAGAAIGAKAKDKSEMTILFREGDRERTIQLQTKDKTNVLFNSICDAINTSKKEREANPDDETAGTASKTQLKTELEKFKEKPASSGEKIGYYIFVGVIVLVAIWLLKGCIDSWNAVAV